MFLEPTIQEKNEKVSPVTLKDASPMMQQWHRCKAKAKDALLLFRLGDFYEAFHNDAHILAQTLELTLTQRHGIPMSGIPSQTIEGYLEKLLAKGHLVAIAEQIEDSKGVKGIVKRDITRIVSPATHTKVNLLNEKANNFFAACCQVNQQFGLALVDITTGEMIVTEVPTSDALFDELFRRTPREIILSTKFIKQHAAKIAELKSLHEIRITEKADWCFDHQAATDFLSAHFEIHSIEAFGLNGMVGAVNASGVLLSHLSEDLAQDIRHIRKLTQDSLSSYLSIDSTTKAHLNIIAPTSSSSDDSLLHLLDQTVTPMGGRRLRMWILHPLLSASMIQHRQDGVEELFPLAFPIREILTPIRDLERLTMRIKTETATPRDLLRLAASLEQLPSLTDHIKDLKSPILSNTPGLSIDLSAPQIMIQTAILDNPPVRITEGGIFMRGYSQELDEYQLLKNNSKEWVTNYQSSLREEIGIKSLKVGFNRAFGYFIEVSRLQSKNMPDTFEKRQTLVNTERYTSSLLKEYEEKILSAEEKIISLEFTYFVDLRKKLLSYADDILLAASEIATLDVLNSFALTAKDHNYIRPLCDEGDQIEIEMGRHPVVEQALSDQTFIPNDTLLRRNDHQLLLITGPNMAGKSTYMRQVALIVIMGQIGCFVPAKSAHIGVVDKLFSRIGASDNLSRGQSTFMVEMLETANILHNATKRSLVILDEIGRGTSTYDGISIAWAVAKYLLTEIGAKTLFATHYWELTQLEKSFESVKNYKVAVQENEDGIVFLHKIIRGIADKSYGIHVAKLAGVPPGAINAANTMLSELEETKHTLKKSPPQKNEQFLLFSQDGDDIEIIRQLRKIDINAITPLEALQKLADWKKLINS